jgi:acetyl esterase
MSLHLHHPLTPAMRQVLDRMARLNRAPFHSMSAQAARAAYRLGAGVLDLPQRPLPRVDQLLLPTRDRQLLPARLYAPQLPEAGDLPCLVYFHGGGFTIGDLDTHDGLCRELAAAGSCAVISVAYRLAPEHRFPTAVHDAWDALSHLLRGEHAIAGLNGCWAVGGDSAGGSLATVCALHARDAGLPLALQLLFYPGCGSDQSSASHQRYAQGLVLDKAHIDWFFGHYIDLEHRRDWRFAPALADDHSGLAPVWMGLAECDPLVDDALAYADVLRMAGVSVDLDIYRGVVHGFIQMGRAIAEAAQAHADAGRALRAAFAPRAD